jgi:antitoxin FitA
MTALHLPGADMTVLTVRNLDPDVKTRLRVRAAQDGVSMEEEVRRILTQATHEPIPNPESGTDLGRRIRARFVGLGELNIPPRHPVRAPIFFDDESFGT